MFRLKMEEKISIGKVKPMKNKSFHREVAKGPKNYANALALNRNNTQIAVAGRSLLKIFSLENNAFTEVCNMRGGKAQNLSYSSNDVAWSHIDNNLLATAATNGDVSVWDLSKFGRQKQILVYHEHERTAHSVTFHTTDPSILISGSQDGTIKCFDLRSEKAAVHTYQSNSESIRDVKFNPHSPNIFAAVSENGSVSLWDLKRPDRCVQQFSAHSGPIYTCDFHPTQNWLATGSRDKQIKVWDLTLKPKIEYTIHTIAVVGRVKWRPDYNNHIASCALVVDYSIHIWDVKRPYIPFASFNEHSNVTTGIAFKTNDPDVLLSTSKDSTIYKHCFKDAVIPFLKANPQGTSVNTKGEILFAKRVHKTPERYSPTPKSSSLSREQMNMFRQSKSVLFRLSHNPAPISFTRPIEEIILDRDYEILINCAKKYKLRGNFQDICDHNANVAQENQKHGTALIWQFIGRLLQIYSRTSIGQNKAAETVTVKNQLNSKPKPHHLEYDKNDLLDHNHFNPERRPTITLKDIHLQSGAIQLPHNQDLIDMDLVFGNSEINFENLDCVQHFRKGFLYMGSYQHIQSDEDRSSIGNDGQSPLQFLHQKSESESDMLAYEAPVQFLQVNQVKEPFFIWDPYDTIKTFLTAEAENGDIQLVASILLALHDKEFEITIDDDVQECWVMSYIELLHRYQLWNEAAYIMNTCQIKPIREINQQSTSVLTSCGSCSKTLTSCLYYCDKCRSSQALHCAFCRLPVKGVYVWCQTCCHGGHIQHMQDWFQQNSKCPICGHLCEYE